MNNLIKFLLFLLVFSSLFAPVKSLAFDAQKLKVVQLYTQDELLDLIKQNKHLARVKSDRCQLNRDIEDHAVKLRIPAYEFLYGDMLAWGVCVKQNAELGIYYIRQSAKQGLVAAIEQMGRYYYQGKFVQKDMDKAHKLTFRAAELGNLNAQLQLVQMHLDGIGSPYDYEQSYKWLHHTIIVDKATHNKAASLLAQLAKLMHPKALERAKHTPY